MPSTMKGHRRSLKQRKQTLVGPFQDDPVMLNEGTPTCRMPAKPRTIRTPWQHMNEAGTQELPRGLPETSRL